jgi:hypothetical protein
VRPCLPFCLQCSSDFLQLLDHKEGWTYVQDISCKAGSMQVFRLKGNDLVGGT